MSKLITGQTVKLIKDAKTGLGSIIQSGTDVRIERKGKNGYFCSVNNIGMYFDASVLEGSIAVKERKRKIKLQNKENLL